MGEHQIKEVNVAKCHSVLFHSTNSVVNFPPLSDVVPVLTVIKYFIKLLTRTKCKQK